MATQRIDRRAVSIRSGSIMAQDQTSLKLRRQLVQRTEHFELRVSQEPIVPIYV